ncbi:MAG: DUF5684 domain-containing protein [Candidatus Hydrogenedentota bacterium]
MVGSVLMFVGMIIVLVSFWRLFAKDGKPGWYVLIPIFNMLAIVKISGLKWWWFLLSFLPMVMFLVAPIEFTYATAFDPVGFLLFLPLAGVFAMIVTGLSLAEEFGKGRLFGLGVVFLPFIFLPVLAFGESEYGRIE